MHVQLHNLGPVIRLPASGDREPGQSTWQGMDGEGTTSGSGFQRRAGVAAACRRLAEEQLQQPER